MNEWKKMFCAASEDMRVLICKITSGPVTNDVARVVLESTRHLFLLAIDKTTRHRYALKPIEVLDLCPMSRVPTLPIEELLVSMREPGFQTGKKEFICEFKSECSEAAVTVNLCEESVSERRKETVKKRNKNDFISKSVQTEEGSDCKLELTDERTVNNRYDSVLELTAENGRDIPDAEPKVEVSNANLNSRVSRLTTTDECQIIEDIPGSSISNCLTRSSNVVGASRRDANDIPKTLYGSSSRFRRARTTSSCEILTLLDTDSCKHMDDAGSNNDLPDNDDSVDVECDSNNNSSDEVVATPITSSKAQQPSCGSRKIRKTTTGVRASRRKLNSNENCSGVRKRGRMRGDQKSECPSSLIETELNKLEDEEDSLNILSEGIQRSSARNRAAPKSVNEGDEPPGVPFNRLPINRGFKYACDHEVYVQYSRTAEKLYLKCNVTNCRGTAFIGLNVDPVLRLLTVTRQHDAHATQDAEISRLTLLSNCRKRAIEDIGTSLRQIFDSEMREALHGLSLTDTSVTFAKIESSMYKKRRSQLPTFTREKPDAPNGASV